MDFSYIFPGVIGRNERIINQKNGKEFNNIYELKKKLIATGYNPCEVDFMIKSPNQGKKLSKLDPIQLQELEAILEAQLHIAIQCLELVKGTNEPGSFAKINMAVQT